MLANVFELEQLSFFKEISGYCEPLTFDMAQLIQLRSFTYRNANYLSKMFICAVADESHRQKYTFLMENPILAEQTFIQLLNTCLPWQQFNKEMHLIEKFKKQSLQWMNPLLQQNAVQQNSPQLQFNVYLTKQNSFSFKFIMKSFASIKFHKIPLTSPPFQDYVVTKEQITIKLRKQYQQLLNFPYPLSKQANQLYTSFYDKGIYTSDNTILELQITHNLPLLRLKFYTHIDFKSALTKQPIKGSIYGNTQLSCLYGHFRSYSAQDILRLQATICELCGTHFQSFQQNKVMLSLRDHVFNPRHEDILYLPEYNRFKLFDPTSKQSRYFNYYHMRSNVKRLTMKNRPIITSRSDIEIFPVEFQLNKKKLRIIDPARGKNCRHYEFTDLRKYYLSRTVNGYKCPIANCGEEVPEQDLLYLNQAIILLEHLQFLCKANLSESSIILNHQAKTISLKYKEEGFSVVQKIKGYYETFIDPYVWFDDSSLQVDESVKLKNRQKFVFGQLETSN